MGYGCHHCRKSFLIKGEENKIAFNSSFLPSQKDRRWQAGAAIMEGRGRGKKEKNGGEGPVEGVLKQTAYILSNQN